MGAPFPGLWSFRHHPWLREMHDCPEEVIIGQKSAQMGYTETALNRVFYNIDVLGVSCLYVLPAATPDASDFSTARFDPALEMSPHLRNLFSDVKNIGHKRAGSASLYVRGSRSRSQLKSIPVGVVVFDEEDEMVQAHIPLATERMSGQSTKQQFHISTPTFEGHGINVRFCQSSQDHFYFPCPHCNRLTELTFPDCLVIIGDNHLDPRVKESHLICKECKARLDHQTKTEWLASGRWNSTAANRAIRGFYINQLYSPTVSPAELAQLYLEGHINPASEQEFYNSKLGLPHTQEGARISDKHILDCMGDFKTYSEWRGSGFVTMGVDVGKWLHYEIDLWNLKTQSNDVNLAAEARVLACGKVLNFEELDRLIHRYGVRYCVIDANPERRKATEFAQRFPDRVKLCFYGTGITGKAIHVHAPEEFTITVDRTSWLDLSLGRVQRTAIQFPADTSLEYKNQLKALVRIYKKDSSGNPVGQYICGNDDDHFAHARNYAEIALSLGAGVGSNSDIRVT